MTVFQSIINTLETLFIHPAFTALLGFIAGHYWTLWREKRKEFNAIADPIRHTLLFESKKPSPYTKGINDLDILRLRDVLPFWKRFRFDVAVRNYQESKDSKNQKNELGTVYFIDTEKIIRSIKSLLKFTKRK